MVDSIHVARWIAQFEPSEVEFTLFPSTPNRRVHAMIRDMMAKNGNIKIVPFGGRLSIPLWGMDLILSDCVRGLLLRGVIRRQQPDFVHALELQHGGYIASRALQDTSIKTPFIATNYGSDIFWFQQFPKHLANIKKVLARADRYSAECNRDVELAKKHGFTGEVMPVFPNAGGFDEFLFQQPLVDYEDRPRVTLKGYDGWAGKATTAIEVFLEEPSLLDGKLLTVLSANRRTRAAVNKLVKKHGIVAELYGKNKLSHVEVLSILSESKVFIGVSKSDGLSTATLEAALMGAFVIQTASSCIFEKLTNMDYVQVIDSPAKEHVRAAISDGMIKSKKEAMLRMEACRTFLHGFIGRAGLVPKSKSFYDLPDKEQ